MTKLLVVEDEPNLLFGIRDILELDGYDVVTARNGVQALDELNDTAKGLPDLIVSDIMMPQMDGIQLLKEVRQKSHWVTIPFIFLTAKGEKTDIQNGKILGVDDYLVKPFEADDLLIAVKAKLQRHAEINKTRDEIIRNIKRSILAMMNHEFRTPLTLVVAYAEMLKETDVEGMNEAELLLFLREINTGADRLRRLIENFILLVELEIGDAKRNYEWRKRAIDDLNDIIKLAHRQVIESRPEPPPCHMHLQADLPPITGDRDYLVAILRELIDNAAKFSPSGKPIVITTTATTDEVEIMVQDQGRGIKEEEMASIWDVFYQTNRDHFEDQGAGSGLAIVRGYSQIHDARVKVQSVYGEGSTFTLALKKHN